MINHSEILKMCANFLGTDVTDKTSVLKVDNGSVGNGTRILQEQNDGRKGTYFTVLTKGDKYIFIVSGGYSSNGANVRLWDKNYANAQKFYIEYARNGEYRIKTYQGKSVDVCGVSPKSGANVWQWEDNKFTGSIMEDISEKQRTICFC